MRVVSLQKHRNKKVVAVTRELLELAECGTLQGLSFVAKLGPRDHRAGIVGAYTERPEEAVYAAVRMKKQLLDDEES
jgi:hypothetical protein